MLLIYRLRFILSFFLLLAWPPAVALSAPIIVRIDVMESPEPGRDSALDYLKKILEQRSYNRMQIEMVNGHKKIERRKTTLTDLQTDRVQIAIVPMADSDALDPLLKVYGLPFLYRNPDHKHRVFDLKIGQQLLSDSFKRNFHILSIWDNGMNHLIQRGPYKSAASTQPAVTGPCACSGPAAAATSPWRQISLEELVDDTARNRQSRIVTTGGHQLAADLLVANQAFWRNLPEDLRVIINDAVKDATAYARELSLQAEQRALKRLADDPQIQLSRLSHKQYDNWRNTVLTRYLGECPAPETELIREIVDTH